MDPIRHPVNRLRDLGIAQSLPKLAAGFVEPFGGLGCGVQLDARRLGGGLGQVGRGVSKAAEEALEA